MSKIILQNSDNSEKQPKILYYLFVDTKYPNIGHAYFDFMLEKGYEIHYSLNRDLRDLIIRNKKWIKKHDKFADARIDRYSYCLESVKGIPVLIEFYDDTNIIKEIEFGA